MILIWLFPHVLWGLKCQLILVSTSVQLAKLKRFWKGYLKINTYFHKNILFSGDSKDQKQKLDQLQKCLKDLITEENKAIKSSHAMARIQGLLNDSLLEGRGLENLEEMFEKALKEQKEPKLNVEKHEMMSKFESR